MIGQSLGPYKIIEPLGAGGMGEVYLGEDTRLGRKVAIKVLPPEFASDAERLARFEQEARAAAALNHPHIAVVHDLGTEPNEDGGDTHYMVQEYLHGRSLRECLDRGALPLEKALDLAGEVAEALVAAHDAGIVHRDLKPDNVFVTEQGHAKVLDFGLAKLTEVKAPEGTSASRSPTMLGTVAGQVMGTAGYMAPEQVDGEKVDRRADLFAFGTVLYEMIAGRRAFSGESLVQTLSKIVHEEPEPLTAAGAEVPPELQRIVGKCLAKKAERRYQHADDLMVDLRRLRDDVAAGVATRVATGVAGSSQQNPTDVSAQTATRNSGWKLTAALAAAAFVAGMLAVWLALRPEPPTPMHLDLITDGAVPISIGSSISISPDGESIAYVTGSFATANSRELRLRRLDEGESTLLVGRESGPYQPFFSPDGQWIGFTSPVALSKVSVAGGQPIPITPGERSRGADWGPDDTIVFAPNPRSGLYLVSAEGGDPEPLTELDDGEATHRWPQFLPGGGAVLFSVAAAEADFATATIEVVDLTTRQRSVVVQGGSYARYVPTGHVVYASEGRLFAVPFDAQRYVASGTAVPVVDDVTTNDEGGAQFSFSSTGTLVYSRSTAVPDPMFQLAWVDDTGNTEPLPFEPRGYDQPRLSPSNDRIAVSVRESNQAHIWILDLATGTSQRLTADGRVSEPVWSHDGQWVYFMFSDTGGLVGSHVWRRRADLGAPAEEVYAAPEAAFPSSASVDGRVLLFHQLAGPRGASPDIGMISLDGEPNPRMLVVTAAAAAEPAISPDGTMFAFQSNETGTDQIYVQNIETQSRRAVSSGGDDNINPIWSRTGDKIYYRSGAGQVSFVEVTREPELSFSAPRRFFELAGFGDAFDVAADGRRLLGTIPAPPGERQASSTRDAQRLEIVLNWFRDLEDRVPTRR